MKAVLLSGDLMVVSRVEGAAARVGIAVRVANDASRAIELCSSESADLLFVDLAAPSLDVKALISRLKTESARSTRVVAFGPHVHEERLAAARDAGCDVVVSRGKFFAELDAILGL